MNNSKLIFYIGFGRCLYEHERNNTITSDLQTLKLKLGIKKKFLNKKPQRILTWN